MKWERKSDFARGFQKQVNDELYARWVVRLYGANLLITMPVGGFYPPPVDRGRLMAVLPPSRAAERGARVRNSPHPRRHGGLGCDRGRKFRLYDAL